MTDGTFTNELENNVLGGGYGYGSITYAEASLNPTTGQLPVYYRGYRANEVAIYGQDDWRVSPRLTMNLGLRWEYFGPPQNFQPGLDANFYQGVPVTPIATTSTNPFFPSTVRTWLCSQPDLFNKEITICGIKISITLDRGLVSAYDASEIKNWLSVADSVSITTACTTTFLKIFALIRRSLQSDLLGAAVGEALITPAQTAPSSLSRSSGTATFATHL